MTGPITYQAVLSTPNFCTYIKKGNDWTDYASNRIGVSEFQWRNKKNLGKVNNLCYRKRKLSIYHNDYPGLIGACGQKVGGMI